jgi:hypothetical protein
MLAGQPDGWQAVELHRMSILDRPRFIRALLPRLAWIKVATSAIYRIWDAQTSYDILLQYVALRFGPLLAACCVTPTHEHCVTIVSSVSVIQSRWAKEGQEPKQQSSGNQKQPQSLEWQVCNQCVTGDVTGEGCGAGRSTGAACPSCTRLFWKLLLRSLGLPWRCASSHLLHTCCCTLLAACIRATRALIFASCSLRCSGQDTA